MVWREIALVHDHGASPMAAIQAATSAAAQLLGAADVTGTVQPGHAADLVLVDGDPLADLGRLAHPRLVVQGGRIVHDAGVTRAQLDSGAQASKPSAQSERSEQQGGCTPVDSLGLRFMALTHDEDGQGLAEYALILALIAIIAIVALSLLGGNVSRNLMLIGTSI